MTVEWSTRTNEPEDDGYDPEAIAFLIAQENARAPIDNRPPIGARLITLDELAALPPPRWLVDGYLELNSLALVYGRRGAHKSFVAVDLLACVASGRRWHGRGVDYGNVIYVSAEGTGGLAKRFDSWRAEYPHETIGDRLRILPEVVNLLSPPAVGEFAEAAAEYGAKLIIFDTLARCMPGGDENTARDAGLVVEQLDSIRRKTGACVATVHHSGHDDSNGARGSSAYEAAMETVIKVSAADDIVTLKQTKQKNYAQLPPMFLRAVAVGESVVLVEHLETNEGVTAGALETLGALAAVQVDGGVSSSTWRLSSGKTDPTFYRHRASLLTLGLVSNVGTEKQPRYLVSDTGAITLSPTSHAPK